MKKAFLCNTSTAPKSTRAHSYDYYLDKIWDAELGFDKLEAICTDGDIKPPYRYQWRATTKIPKGADDPFEGLGDTPLNALKALLKAIQDHASWVDSLTPEELEENFP